MGLAGKEATRPPSHAARSRGEPARSFARDAAFSPDALQRRFGNQGAGALLGSLSRGGGAEPPVRSASSLGCCGSSQLQARPAVGPAHDRSERGAGTAVDRVMRMEDAQPAEGSGGQLQAASDAVAHTASDVPSPSADAGRQAPVQADAAEIGGSTEVTGVLTPHDDFAGRSMTSFGVAEKIDLGFVSTPARPATKSGGLKWQVGAGGGTLAGVTDVGTATYTAPPTADAVRLDLCVATGARAGRIVASNTISIIEPDSVEMVAIPILAGSLSPEGGAIARGTFGAGFLAHVFIGPNDVSFRFVEFREGIVMSVITPPGSFLGQPVLHPPSNFGFGVGGDSAKGTMTGVDQITVTRPPRGSFLGMPSCGASDFVWEIPWEFRPGGTGPRAKFATATHHVTSTSFCDATIEKGGAGPFCRQIDGTTC